jgi:hypothetical protein
VRSLLQWILFVEGSDDAACCGVFAFCLLSSDRLCGLVARVPGYRSRGPDSIPGATRFSEKQWVCNGVHSAS